MSAKSHLVTMITLSLAMIAGRKRRRVDGCGSIECVADLPPVLVPVV